MPKSHFRPCIDLHDGQVKQIVGGTLSDNETASSALVTNFVATHPPSYFAELYRKHNLTGGHVIKLGPNNDKAATEALAAWPGQADPHTGCTAITDGSVLINLTGGLQVGGGISEANALDWLAAGAEKIIVTSWLFPNARFDLNRLQRISKLVGKDKLVVDVSCRRKGNKWIVAMNKWQDLTDMEVNKESLDILSEYCSEFLVHAADVEGLCQGIDEQLVERLGDWVTIPTTYAGGAKSISDLDLVNELSSGKVDLTYGSALDIFGGKAVNFEQLVEKSGRDSHAS